MGALILGNVDAAEGLPSQRNADWHEIHPRLRTVT